MDLTPILLSAQSDNQQALNEAQTQLKNLEQAHFAGYVSALVAEMGTETKPPASRQLAGLLIKNSLVARDSVRRAELQERWLKLDNDVRSQIKNMLLTILQSPVKDVRSTSSLAISSIASIEIPHGVWPDLIHTLTRNVKDQNPHLRQASFECLGYVCEENGKYLDKVSNEILTAISVGMNQSESPADQSNNQTVQMRNDIKYAATQALANSLDFVEANMNREAERNAIMTMVFTAAGSEDSRVRVAALQCLVQIAATYYQLIEPYMQHIFTLTNSAMTKETDDVQLQAIEFWATVSDAEIALKEEADEAEYTQSESAGEISAANKQYIKHALPTLVPRLLELLTHQNDDVDDETWNPAMAAATCLSLAAQAAGDPIVPLVLSFVQQHIASANWRFKEAATIAFGCILDGPSIEQIRDLAKQGLPVILTNMQDQNELVKDTAAWTIGRICDLVPEITTPQFEQLMTAFMHGLRDVPSIAASVCWSIHNLATACVTDDSEANTNIMSNYFRALIETLMIVVDRPDTDKSNLLSSAYEAINSLIACAARDMYDLIAMLLTPLCKKLESTLTSNALSASEREKQHEAQALLCGALQSIIQKLDLPVIQSHADQLMMLFIGVLEANSKSANSTISSSVSEEVLMAIGALANRVGAAFERFIAALQPFLMKALDNAADYKVLIVAVGLVGDISRALSGRFESLSDPIMGVLLGHLQSADIERSVKPPIISCLGDIAMAVGQFFARYLPYVHRILIPASALEYSPDAPYEDFEYLDDLRSSIVDAWTAIIHDTKDMFLIPLMDEQGKPVADPIDHVGKFLQMLARQPDIPDSLLRHVCGLIGDLGSVYGARIRSKMCEPATEQAINQLVQWAQQRASTSEDDGGDQSLATEAHRAQEEMHRVRSG